MAKSQTITLRGQLYWARLFEDDREMFEYNDETGTFDKPSTTDGSYVVQVALDMEEYRKLKRSGSLAAKHSKENEAGLEVVKLRRPHRKIGKGGKVLEFASGSPRIVNAAGQPWNKETDGLIGNETVADVTVVVYETAFSPGTRLEEVKIIDHVKYDPDEVKPKDEVAF